MDRIQELQSKLNNEELTSKERVKVNQEIDKVKTVRKLKELESKHNVKPLKFYVKVSDLLPALEKSNNVKVITDLKDLLIKTSGVSIPYIPTTEDKLASLKKNTPKDKTFDVTYRDGVLQYRYK